VPSVFSSSIGADRDDIGYDSTDSAANAASS
jgi:hypothetical protein